MKKPINENHKFRPKLSGTTRKETEKLKKVVKDLEKRLEKIEQNHDEQLDLRSLEWRRSNLTIDLDQVLKAAVLTTLNNKEEFKRRMRGKQALSH